MPPSSPCARRQTSSSTIQLWRSSPPTPSGFSMLWSGPAMKPSRETATWKRTMLIGALLPRIRDRQPTTAARRWTAGAARMRDVRTLVWRRIDEPGMEAARVESLSDASGVQIGRMYELRWELRGDRLGLELNGERRQTVELGDADFFDVFASPFFNSLPVMRDGLLVA